MDILIKTMLEHAKNNLSASYAPYSNYLVSCCICSDDDNLFTGVNVENSSFSLSICAETSAIAQMIAKGQKSIKHVVIIAGDGKLCPPCGACRQRIYEFSKSHTTIYLCNHQEVLKKISINALLPLAFELTPSNG